MILASKSLHLHYFIEIDFFLKSGLRIANFSPQGNKPAGSYYGLPFSKFFTTQFSPYYSTLSHEMDPVKYLLFIQLPLFWLISHCSASI